MDIQSHIVHLQVTLVIDRLSREQLAEVGKRLQSLPAMPKIRLVKQVPFFPAQFYGPSDTSKLERKMLREATPALLEALDRVGVRATYQVVRGSHPSQLSAKGRVIIQTMIEFTKWFASLEALIEMQIGAEVANC